MKRIIFLPALLLFFSLLTQFSYGMIEDEDIEKEKPIAKQWVGPLTQKMLKALKKASEEGDENAQNMLIAQYEITLPSMGDPKEFPWLTERIFEERIATHPGYVSMFFTRFTEQFENKIKDITNMLLSNTETEGDPLSYYNYGLIHCYGYGVERNYTEALKWLTKAAELKYPQALYLLGCMNKGGDSLKQDLGEAYKFFAKAENHPLALLALGNAHLEGKGVKQDPLKGLDLMLQSGTGKHVNSPKGIIKKYLTLNTFLPNPQEEEGVPLTQETLDDLHKKLEMMEGGFLHQIKRYDVKGDLFDNEMGIGEICEAYQVLNAFRTKITSILNVLKSVKIGFMTTYVVPTEELGELFKKDPSSKAVSKIMIHKKAYMMFGFENHELWERYKNITQNFDLEEELEGALKALTGIEYVYKNPNLGNILVFKINRMDYMAPFQEEVQKQQILYNTLEKKYPTKEELENAKKMLVNTQETLKKKQQETKTKFEDGKEKLEKIKNPKSLEEVMRIAPYTRDVFKLVSTFIKGFFKEEELHKRNLQLANEFLPQEWEPKE